MKEIAICIPTIKWTFLVTDYMKFEYPKDDIGINWMAQVKEKICEQVFAENQVPSRVYFGTEFCERLLWTEAQVRKMAEICAANGLKMSLVTPYCSDQAIERICNILNACADVTEIDEIIVNDWGVLQRLKADFPQYRRVFGRMLDKMKRDPRMSKAEYHKHFSEKGLRILQSPTASSPEYQQFMTEQEVDRFEIDNVIQGLYLEDTGNKHISVYVPYGFITNGKICQFAGINHEPQNKFQVGTKCSHECQRLMQIMQKNLSVLPSETDEHLDKIRVIRKGNTVFFMNHDVTQCLNDIHIDRIVYEPVLPI